MADSPPFRSIAQELAPPVLWRAMRTLRDVSRPRPDPNALFDGDDELFKAAAARATVYGEYGVGQSTQWMLANSTCPVIAVDTSAEWIQNVKNGAPDASRLQVQHVDLGEVGEWGRPKTYAQRHKFVDYASWPWSCEQKPDLVLVDGRFRVACFLYSLLQAEPGATIIFDDYVDRPHYHLVEEFIRPQRTSVRQALFVVPEGLDRVNIESTRDKFLYVMD